jgi:hypothetical protein
MVCQSALVQRSLVGLYQPRTTNEWIRSTEGMTIKMLKPKNSEEIFPSTTLSKTNPTQNTLRVELCYYDPWHGQVTE